MTPLMWSCHVCKEERPDAYISVWNREEAMAGGISVTTNIRYCNDRPWCVEGVKTFSFFGAN